MRFAATLDTCIALKLILLAALLLAADPVGAMPTVVCPPGSAPGFECPLGLSRC